MTDTTTVGVTEEETVGAGGGDVSLLIHGKMTAQEFFDTATDVTPDVLAGDLVMMLSTSEILLTGARGEGVPISQIMQAFVDVLTIAAPENENLPHFNNQITSLRYLSGDVSLEEFFELSTFEGDEDMSILISETQEQLDNPVGIIILSMGQQVEPSQAFEKMTALVEAAQAKFVG